MNPREFQLQGLRDPRLAVHAVSPWPAWLWSSDGARILWANPVGAQLFDAAHASELANRTFGPADLQRRQIARLAGRLPLSGAIRLERLSGFGATLGTLATCGCARLEFADGSHGILVAATEGRRTMPLLERLQRLVEDIATPVAAFDRDGELAGASVEARALLGFKHLSEVGLDDIRNEALRQGRAKGAFGTGDLVLHRVGSGADVGLVALISPATTKAAPPRHPAAVDRFTERTPDTSDREASHVEPPANTFDIETPLHEPSPYVEAVADEPVASGLEPAPSSPAEPSHPRRHPLRFTWRMDAEGRFRSDTGEFNRLIGSQSVATFGRPWNEIAATLGLDDQARVGEAIATQQTWTGIVINWPVDGGHLPVELSGLPIYDRMNHFAGYRGFGVCRDFDGLTRLTERHHHDPVSEPPAPQPLSGDVAGYDAAEAPRGDTADDTGAPVDGSAAMAEAAAPDSSETSPQTDVETPVETPPNVVLFRPISDPKTLSLSPVENSAFNELARQLSARLDSEDDAMAAPATADAIDRSVEPPPAAELPEPPVEMPQWLAPPEPPARGESRRDKTLLTLLPIGVLIYRLDRLLYANAAFLARLGYESLHALEQAGGLEALYVETVISTTSSTSHTGTPVTISATQASSEHAPPSAIDARLYTISWDDDQALALIFSDTGAESANIARAESPALEVGSEPSAVGQANAEELGAILDTTAEGIVMFDAEGNIHACNRSAEALFGYDGAEFVQRKLADLFAPESQRMVLDYLQSTREPDVASLLDHGREVLGRVRQGGIIPLSMTMGRTSSDGPNFFALFRDLSSSRRSENELQQAQRLTERAASAKADMLARISHEVRTPLNAIIGFAEVMIAERFGVLGNERYIDYMKDIRASGQRVLAVINDLTDLSRIETGKIELAFVSLNLNDLVESCVAVLQPQANRERIIIRTSLAHALPPIFADARALRQITLNLINNSIHLANAGGQVIVSTALSDFGDVVLRVRDTGHGLNDNEVAAAMEPFRTRAPSDQVSGSSSGVNLSLTKALVEANRAQFQIKTGPHSGTLIEVMFTRSMARVQN